MTEVLEIVLGDIICEILDFDHVNESWICLEEAPLNPAQKMQWLKILKLELMMIFLTYPTNSLAVSRKNIQGYC